MLVVVVGGDGAVAKDWRSSKLFTDAGGLRGTSSDFREGRGLVMVERRLSMIGFVMGGGILMLALSVMALFVSAKGLRRRSAELVAASKECVDAVLSVREAPPAVRELAIEEELKTGEIRAPLDWVEVPEPFVGVL